MNEAIFSVVLLMSISVQGLAKDSSDRFFSLYSSGKFSEAYEMFDEAIQSKKPNLNKETMYEIIESIFPQLPNPDTNDLYKKLTDSSSAKMLFFTRKRLRATIKEVMLFEKYRNAPLLTVAEIVESTANIRSTTLTYPHEKNARLRVLLMVLDYRSMQKTNSIADDYLKALIHFNISKSGQDYLVQYFSKADQDNAFYSKAKILRNKMNN